MPPELLAQFPIAEAAVEALGLVLWPMVEFEADDAIAAAAVRFGDDRRSSGSSSARPTRTWPSSSATTGSCCWDRRRDLTYDDAGVRAEVGRAADLDPRLARPWSATASDGFPGLPGWGAKSAAAVLTPLRLATRRSRRRRSAWEVPGLGGRGRCALAATLRDHWDDALLYRDLARLRTADDGVVIRQRDADELRWDGAPRAEWEAFCEEWGLARLRDRPHRWLED